jgi:hypothetical protein
MALDALGNRPAAVAAYRLTLRLPDAAQAHARARGYLQRAFSVSPVAARP